MVRIWWTDSPGMWPSYLFQVHLIPIDCYYFVKHLRFQRVCSSFICICRTYFCWISSHLLVPKAQWGKYTNVVKWSSAYVWLTPYKCHFVVLDLNIYVLGIFRNTLRAQHTIAPNRGGHIQEHLHASGCFISTNWINPRKPHKNEARNGDAKQGEWFSLETY